MEIVVEGTAVDSESGEEGKTNTSKSVEDKEKLLKMLSNQITTELASSAVNDLLQTQLHHAAAAAAEAKAEAEAEAEFGHGDGAAGACESVLHNGRGPAAAASVEEGTVNEAAVAAAVKRVEADMQLHLDFENTACVKECVHYEAGNDGDLEEVEEECEFAEEDEEERVAGMSGEEQMAEEHRVKVMRYSVL